MRSRASRAASCAAIARAHPTLNCTTSQPSSSRARAFERAAASRVGETESVNHTAEGGRATHKYIQNDWFAPRRVRNARCHRRFRARGAVRTTDCARARAARRDARRVRARHPRAVIAPTHTDALAHYSTSRRIKRADPGAIGVDGRPSASTDGDPTDARLWGCGARVISSSSSRARPRPRAARPLAARIPRVARRASHFARDVRAARARERLDRPRMARRSTRAATPSPETPSRAATRGAERGAGAALVFMVFVFFAAWSFGSLQYDRVDTRS